MNSFPFFRFPYNNYYYRRPYNYSNGQKMYENYNRETKSEEKVQADKYENNSEQENRKINGTKNTSSKYKSFGPIRFKNPLDGDIDLEEPIIEILGIKLYLDDIIILGLLFILYQEEVKDDMLFLSLVLLLLT